MVQKLAMASQGNHCGTMYRKSHNQEFRHEAQQALSMAVLVRCSLFAVCAVRLWSREFPSRRVVYAHVDHVFFALWSLAAHDA